MEEALDAGPLYAVRETAIAPGDTAGTLSSRLAGMGAALLAETLAVLSRGSAVARPQEGEPTYCRTIRRADGEIDWSRPADFILRMRRAYTPWPGIFTQLEGERVKILEAHAGPSSIGNPPGAILSAAGEVQIACGEGTSIVATLVQREGRNPASGEEFRRGLRGAGERFGG